MKSLKIFEKNRLYEQLLNSIDMHIGRGVKPIITFEFVSDKGEIPEPNDGFVRWVASKSRRFDHDQNEEAN